MAINGVTSLQPSMGAGIKPAPVSVEKGFGDLMDNLVQKVDGMQKSADASVVDVVSGKETDIHQVAVKVQEAGVAFDLMLGVRNRLMDAYQELMRMQA
jgi:flagellar hook-basal body complex protein FliE